MFIITCKIDDEGPIELIVGNTTSLIRLAIFLEYKKTPFKVSSTVGHIDPESYGWAPLNQWEYWKMSLQGD